VPPRTYLDVPPIADDRSERQELFVRLLSDAYPAIRACVTTLVINRSDADDVYQEVCVVLWRRFDEFDFGASFRRWACGIALNCARDYWKREKKRRGVALSDEALTRLARVREGCVELIELRRELLDECIEQLPEKDRQIIRDSYADQSSLIDVARDMGRSVASLYAKLSRIRQRLADCVQKKMR